MGSTGQWCATASLCRTPSWALGRAACWAPVHPGSWVRKRALRPCLLGDVRGPYAWKATAKPSSVNLLLFLINYKAWTLISCLIFHWNCVGSVWTGPVRPWFSEWNDTCSLREICISSVECCQPRSSELMAIGSKMVQAVNLQAVNRMHPGLWRSGSLSRFS